ncbi:MAG: hypothetical protein ACXVB9_06815 [Bdellovibrionota bacterium]
MIRTLSFLTLAVLGVLPSAARADINLTPGGSATIGGQKVTCSGGSQRPSDGSRPAICDCSTVEQLNGPDSRPVRINQGRASFRIQPGEQLNSAGKAACQQITGIAWVDADNCTTL